MYHSELHPLATAATVVQMTPSLSIQFLLSLPHFIDGHLDIVVFIRFHMKREVLEIINSATIGLILKLPMLPELNNMLGERSRNVPYPLWTFQY